jgi:hypothetical protein
MFVKFKDETSQFIDDDFIDDPLDGKEPNIYYYQKQLKMKDDYIKQLLQQLKDK